MIITCEGILLTTYHIKNQNEMKKKKLICFISREKYYEWPNFGRLIKI